MSRMVRTLVAVSMAVALFFVAAPTIAHGQPMTPATYPPPLPPDTGTPPPPDTGKPPVPPDTAGPPTPTELPETGTDPCRVAQVALVLLVAGATLVILTVRRRRPAS